MSMMPRNAGIYGQPNDTGVLMQDGSSQRRLAAELRKQGSGELQGQMISGHYVAPSWSQGLAKVLQSTLSGYAEENANKQEKDYAAEKSRKFAEILAGNKPQQIAGEPTVTSTIPAYAQSQQDQFGSPLPNVQRQPVVTETPTMTQETPEAMQARQQQATLGYMQQYGATPEGQYLMAQMDKQGDRAYAKGEKLDDRTYADNRESTLHERDRGERRFDINDQRTYEDIVRKEQQGFQVSQQERQFAQAFKMQAQSQGFAENQQGRSQAFTANENALNRQNQVDMIEKRATSRPNKGLSVTAQKELIDAEDGIQGSREAVKAFKKAQEINSSAMGGVGAGALATAGGILPKFMRPDTVDKTKELDNVLQGSALPQLKAIFGGMPTEGERAILLEVQGSSGQTAEVRKGIFDRAIKAANNRIEYNSQKAKQLRNGTYFTEEGGIKVDEQPATKGGWGIEVVK